MDVYSYTSRWMYPKNIRNPPIIHLQLSICILHNYICICIYTYQLVISKVSSDAKDYDHSPVSNSRSNSVGESDKARLEDQIIFKVSSVTKRSG